MKLLVDVSPLRDSRPFRRLFVARTLMLVGVGMAGLSVPIQVYGLTGSTSAVAAVSAVQAVAFFAGFVGGGILADRVDRWSIVSRVRLVSVVSFAGLALDAATGGRVVVIAALMALNGLAGSVGITALLAVTPSLVGKDRLAAAAALNTLSLRLGTIVSPLIAGIVFTVAGPVWNYAAAAVLGLATTPLLRRPADLVLPPRARSLPVGEALAGGYRFVAGQPVVRGVVLAGMVGMLGGGSFVLIPALVDARFGGDPAVVGYFYAALGTGLVGGSLLSGGVGGSRRPGRLLLSAMTLSFLALAAAGASPVLALVLLLLAAAGAGTAVEEVLRYALLQTNTPDDLRGRVTSVFAAQNMAATAVGALLAGALEPWLGAATFWTYNLVLAGVSVVVAVLLPALRQAGPR